jgi:hypothetical protein
MPRANSIVFSFVRISDNSMVASIRILKYVAAHLKLPEVDYQNIRQYDGAELDVLYIVNGAYGFCKCLPELAALVKTARRIVWIQNDYSIIPPKIESEGISPFRAAFRERHEAGKPHMDFWSTCEEWSQRKGSSYVNWNMLTFDKDFSEKRITQRRGSSASKTLLYYGSYRDGSGKSSRVPLFDRYFAEPTVATTISSPAKQFAERYPKCTHVGPILDNFYNVLGTNGLGLYIEDRKSSENFHSPANRFYEMLSAGLPMVFQQECGPMLRKAGYDPAPWVVEKARDVAKFMVDRDKHGLEQRRQWIRGNYHGLLLEQMKSAQVKLEREMA